MIVDFRDGTIVVAGDCPVATAETLLALLLEHPAATVDMELAGAVHTALWQMLMASTVTIVPPLVESVATKWIFGRTKRSG